MLIAPTYFLKPGSISLTHWYEKDRVKSRTPNQTDLILGTSFPVKRIIKNSMPPKINEIIEYTFMEFDLIVNFKSVK